MPDISVDLVERFYAILAIAAIGGMILLGTLRILAIQSDPALDAYATIARDGMRAISSASTRTSAKSTSGTQRSSRSTRTTRPTRARSRRPPPTD